MQVICAEIHVGEAIVSDLPKATSSLSNKRRNQIPGFLSGTKLNHCISQVCHSSVLHRSHLCPAVSSSEPQVAEEK